MLHVTTVLRAVRVKITLDCESIKNTHAAFCDNFGKYEPTLIILSALHSTMNCGRRYHITRHLTSNLLLHYLAKFERSTVQLYTIVVQFISVTHRLLTVNIHRNVIFLDHMSVLNAN